MRTTVTAQTPPRARPGFLVRPAAISAATVAAAVLVGMLLRAWVLSSDLGVLDSDEAIIGLMARHALDGEVSALVWLSPYGGSHESLLAAAVFAVAGSSVLALKLTSIAFFATAAVLVWIVGRRTVGEPAARLGAALFWLWPPFFVWFSTKARGYYGAALVCGLLVVLLALRLRERDSRIEAALLGLAVGVGAWVAGQTALLAVPAVAWLVWQRPGVVRHGWVALPSALVGASPWLIWNARHDWIGFPPKAVAGSDTSYIERFADLFTTVLPTWLGLRLPFSLDWTLGRVVGAALTAAAVVAFVLLLVRRARDPRLGLLFVIGAAFPFLYAASSFTYYVRDPRYVVFLGPVIALLVGRALAAHWATAALGLALAAGLSLTGLVQMERQALHNLVEPGVPPPADVSPLVTVLDREGVTRVLAPYWVAYRLSFETDERILATSTGFVRHAETDRIVRSDPAAAHVFVVGSRAEATARPRLEARRQHRLRADGWVVYLPRG
jgi:hypothetical protein